MKKSVTVKTVRILASLVLEIGWSTGETLRLDMSACTAPPFDALADPDFFARVELEPWGGHGLDWPNGLSMDADRLYELCREQAGLPTPGTLEAWMARNGLSLTTAAESLGLTRQMITRYCSGGTPIPKLVGLACKGWEAEHQPRP